MPGHGITGPGYLNLNQERVLQDLDTFTYTRAWYSKAGILKSLPGQGTLGPGYLNLYQGRVLLDLDT